MPRAVLSRRVCDMASLSARTPTADHRTSLPRTVPSRLLPAGVEKTGGQSHHTRTESIWELPPAIRRERLNDWHSARGCHRRCDGCLLSLHTTHPGRPWGGLSRQICCVLAMRYRTTQPTGFIPDRRHISELHAPTRQDNGATRSLPSGRGQESDCRDACRPGRTNRGGTQPPVSARCTRQSILSAIWPG